MVFVRQRVWEPVSLTPTGGANALLHPLSTRLDFLSFFLLLLFKLSLKKNLTSIFNFNHSGTGSISVHTTGVTGVEYFTAELQGWWLNGKQRTGRGRVGSPGKGGDSGSYFLPCYHLSCMMKGRCLQAGMIRRKGRKINKKLKNECITHIVTSDLLLEKSDPLSKFASKKSGQ